MKILHMADVHLDSKFSRHFDNAKAKERKNELLVTFKNAISYAVNNDVEAIIIAGDLFDVSKISATSRDSVLDQIINNPDIIFYYLQGNHDAGSFVQRALDRVGELPSNLKMFSGEWKSYRQVGQDNVEIVITGAEITAENNDRLVASLSLDHNDFNIVTLHGQEVETAAKKDAEVIPLKDYRHRGIDYMALGHIHAPKKEELDARGIYSYPGCLEGRGYDECGPHGFNLIEVTGSKGNYKMDFQFVPFAKRIIYWEKLDVSGLEKSDDIVRKIYELVHEKNILAKDMLRVELTGKVGDSTKIDVDYIEASLREDFYHVKIEDKTKPFVDYAGFINDRSLRGQFVRLIKEKQDNGSLSDDEAAEITRLGIDVLAGEDVI